MVIGAASSVRASCVECERLPEVPVNVIVDVAAAAVRAAVNVVLCAVPGVRFNVAGFAVTPAGSPLIVTETALAKELSAAAVRLTGKPVAPPVIVSVAGDTDNVKSGSEPMAIASVAE